ncbi:uncharacterized protein N7443_000077 [Penicillium atrosanguineum]|uniref:uncharacterized protein n=1 Tax=Penicillium atrosanguineum TaxID=1132637 RepID=UPI00238412B1|nr:uncharacterized protein N7443_000077 [Penicillium atrosanguineum]KAJ5313193.1 hypothetical protein N7443_000077 [Penicillium atrosanguineum]
MLVEMDSDIHEAGDTRLPKRTRQACDPCRRKKSKCSGERPICATCYRLGARCSYRLDPLRYAPYPHDNGVSRQHHGPSSLSKNVIDYNVTSTEPRQPWDRIESLESTLAEVIERLRGHRATNQLPTLSPISPRHHASQNEGLNPSHVSDASQPVAISSGHTNDSRSAGALDDELDGLSWESAVNMAETYLIYCDCQPLPLFHRESFVSTFPNRELEIVYSVVALASRFDNSSTMSSDGNSIPEANKFSDAAHQRIMSQITSGRVELSTLQTLCLLALIEFSNGETTQSCIHSSLAMTLANCVHLHHKPASPYDERQIEERSRCYWSIILLRRLFGQDSGKPLPSPSGPRVPRIPASPIFPSMTVFTEEGQDVAKSQKSDEQNGILYVVVKLSEVWCRAQEYISNRGSSDSGMDPWSLSSAYSAAMESAMKLDQQLPSIHRYRFIRLSTVTASELDESRDYWGPWFLSRLLYHTSICIINHPILIMFQLQGRRHVSELFLQQTTFQRNHHTSWVLHFIEFMASRQFYISDPLFAYCAAVVATIELHQSFVEEKQHQHKQRRRQSYQACLDLIARLTDTWPALEHVINKLNNLKQHMSSSYESNFAKNDGKICVDVSIFFSILDLPKFYTSERSMGADESIFGPSLTHESCPELFRRAQLPLLPLITVMEPSSDVQPRHGDITTDGNGAAPQLGFPANTVSQFPISDDSMLFPAEQFFGAFLCPNVNPWEPMMDMAGSNVPPQA